MAACRVTGVEHNMVDRQWPQQQEPRPEQGEQGRSHGSNQVQPGLQTSLLQRGRTEVKPSAQVRVWLMAPGHGQAQQ